MKELFVFGVLVFPFIFVAALSRELARETKNAGLGWRLFLVAVAVLALNWVWGYLRGEALMAEQRWTAASFAIALIILRSVPLVAVCWAVEARLVRRYRPKL